MKRIKQNIENLTSLWKAAALPFDSCSKFSAFNCCEITGTDWPNRLWFTNAIDQNAIELAKEKLESSSKLIIPYWHTQHEKTYEILEQNSFELQFEQTGMCLELKNKLKLQPNLQVIPVRTKTDAKIWAEIYPKSFGYRIDEKILLATWNTIRYFLVYNQNQAIGTVILFRSKNVLGVHGLGIVPEMRKKGFAKQIMQILINMAIEEKFDCITLQASEMGKNIYLNLGFTEQFTIRNYIYSEKN